MNNSSWYFTKGVFVYTVYPNNFVTNAMKSNMHAHLFILMGMREGKEKCVKYSLFFIVYIRKFELGFW